MHLDVNKNPILSFRYLRENVSVVSLGNRILTKDLNTVKVTKNISEVSKKKKVHKPFRIASNQ